MFSTAEKLWLSLMMMLLVITSAFSITFHRLLNVTRERDQALRIIETSVQTREEIVEAGWKCWELRQGYMELPQDDLNDIEIEADPQ